MCPSDTYKVYKQGSNVRIDTTLLGFDHTSWQRGNRSYVFQGHSKLLFEDLIFYKNKILHNFNYVQLMEMK